VAFRDALDWEEGAFRALLGMWRRLHPATTASSELASAALFDDEVGSLSVLAQLLTGEPVRVRRARDAGGVRGADLLLPASFDIGPDLETNRDAYRVQVVVASGVRRLTRGLRAPPAGRYETALEGLRIARQAVDLMSAELPKFAELHDRVLSSVLAARERSDVSRLTKSEACLEGARRAALAGECVWDDHDLRARLVGQRTGRARSRELPVWGEWMATPDEASVGSPVGESQPAEEPTTELDAPSVDALRRVDLESKDTQDPPPAAPFERAESLDSYRGGARDLDGADDLEAHLEALEQVDLGELFRGSQGAQSLLKADLELGLDVADARELELGRRGIAYDEWDARKRAYRKAWCTVYPALVPCAQESGGAWANAKLALHRELVRELRIRLELQRAGLRGVPRQLDGEEIDLVAAVDDRVARIAGRESDPRVYLRQKKRRREFATTVLIDVSMSTDSWVEGRRILDVAREAALVLGEVAEQLGDRIQLLAFASETRNRCQVFEVLGFGESWREGRARLGSLEPQGYTRIGPALRHATALLANEPAEKRLLLLLSDGKPTDYDRYEGRYGIADVRMALREAERLEIHPHALAIDAVARDYLPSLFGAGGWHVLPQPEQLVEALTVVYGRLTAR
jgi:nitric oxide reductase NorD protein